MTRTGGRRLGLRIALSVVPFLGMCGAVPWANRVQPYVLGMPFLVFWVGAWSVLTSGCMALVHVLRDGGRETGGAQTRGARTRGAASDGKRDS